MLFPSLGLLVIAIGIQYLFDHGYRVNWTRSMPLGIYHLENPGITIAPGDLVEFCPPEWVTPQSFPFYPRGRCPNGGEPMLKEVVAASGDQVEVADSGVLINGVPLQNSMPLTRPGLPRIRQSFTLKNTEIWVFGSGASPELAQHSFDSRYFGPVSISFVMGVQEPNASDGNFRARENQVTYMRF